MAEIFDVQYNIDVFSSSAVQGINKFVNAVNRLSEVSTKLQNFQTTLRNIETMSTKGFALNIKTDVALKRLERVYNKLGQIKNTAAKINLGVQGGVAGQGTKKTRVNAAQSVIAPMSAPTTKQPRPRTLMKSKAGTPLIPNNLEYQVLGPTRLGNVAMLDMFKGMGIMYGISAIGSGIRDIVTTSAEYQNVMQTARNILKTNYTGRNFNAGFANMEAIARQVGVETKFTAPEVADAVKFLAMAGLDINAISKSIRPIADIALIGDTDLGTTADVLTNIMTGYDILPENMRKTADIMTRTFTMSNTTLMEMAESFKMAAPLLNLNKVPFETAAAMIGVLGDAGVKGTMAGTTIRTIMNNLMNPTKKQQKEWERLGIQTKDDNGNLRNLNDIFYELNERRLGGENVDIYKLFRLTAASGAGALMQHVDKWNQIIEQNFLSAGLSDKLAEEKKNQVTGLWAQLKSAFQETGLQVFEENDSKIKTYLRKGINWLKSGEFKDILRSVFGLVETLGESLKNFTKIIFELYKKFEPFINRFLRFQLYLKAFQTILGGIKQVGHAILYSLTPLFNGIGRMAQYKGWSGLGGFSNAYVTAGGGTMVGGMNPMLAWWANRKTPTSSPIPAFTGFAAPSGNIPLPMQLPFAYPPEYQKQLKSYNRRMRKANAMNAWSGMGSILGTVGGYFIGDSINDQYGGMIGSAVGMGLGSILPGLLAGSGPLGWIIAGVVAATTGAIMTVRKYNKNIAEGEALTRRWTESVKNLGLEQLNYNDHEAVIRTSMEIMNSNLLTTNDRLDMQVKLWRKLADARKGYDDQFSPTSNFASSNAGKVFMQTRDNAYKVLGGETNATGTRDAVLSMMDAMGVNFDYNYAPGVSLPGWIFSARDENGLELSRYKYNDIYANPRQNINAWAALQMAYSTDLEPYNTASRNLRSLMSGVTTLEQYNNVLARFKGDNLPVIDMNKNINDLSDEELNGLSWEELMTYPAFGVPYTQRMMDLVRQYEPYRAFLEEMERAAAGQYELSSAQKAFSDKAALLLPQYGSFGSDSWFSNLNNLVYLSKDQNGNMNFPTPLSFKEAIEENFDIVQREFENLPDAVKPYFLRFLNVDVWNRLIEQITGLQGDLTGGYSSPKTEEEKDMFGKGWTWDDTQRMWLFNNLPGLPSNDYGVRSWKMTPPSQEDINRVLGENATSTADTLLSYIAPNINEELKPRQDRQLAQAGQNITINVNFDKGLNVENMNGINSPEEFAEIASDTFKQLLIEISQPETFVSQA